MVILDDPGLLLARRNWAGSTSSLVSSSSSSLPSVTGVLSLSCGWEFEAWILGVDSDCGPLSHGTGVDSIWNFFWCTFSSSWEIGGTSRFLLSIKVACCSGDMVIIRPSSRRRMCCLNFSNKGMTSWIDEKGWMDDFLEWMVKDETYWDLFLGGLGVTGVSWRLFVLNSKTDSLL